MSAKKAAAVLEEELVGGDVLEDEELAVELPDGDDDESYRARKAASEQEDEPYEDESYEPGPIARMVHDREIEREYRLEMYEPGDYRLKARVLELSIEGWKYPVTVGFRPPNRAPFVILTMSRDKLA